MIEERRWSARDLMSELNRYEQELRDAGKTRNTINTYVQHPERFIKWLERNHPTQADAKPGRGTPKYERNHPTQADTKRGRGKSKYDPLKKYLAERTDPEIRLSFREIERIVGFELPDSARRLRQFWENPSDKRGPAAAWMEAGRYTTNVNFTAETVDFVR
jgi:hypothetical protein